MSDDSNTVVGKIEFYSPLKVTIVDPDNILFIIHRRGFITCVCGSVMTKHVCNVQSNFKNLKIKFNLCPKKETCRFCEDNIQWHYERYMNKDDKLFCRKYTKEIKDKGICEDYFCITCYKHLDDCICCKLCLFNQCVCNKYDNDSVSIDKFDLI